MPELCINADIIHGHGLWLHTNWITGRYARNSSKPLVISPRGSLLPRRLAHSSIKKEIAALLFDRSNLRYASCIHATSEIEYESVRAYGLDNPVAVIPNGVAETLLDTTLSENALVERFPEIKNKKIILYLSRLSWEKGLPLLAAAWAKLAAQFADWHLLIAGKGESQYEEEIRRIFDSKGLSARVTWTGLLLGREKISAYAVADLFVLPTHSENFGLVVAEALAAGVPVITTHGAPWNELVEYGCGWWVPIDEDDLAEALRVALSLPDAERRRMGENGRQLVLKKYSWDAIAKNMMEVYQWVLSGGIVPPCVRLS
jgi:glycosyltransferase involved in cell wall biosynthesis